MSESQSGFGAPTVDVPLLKVPLESLKRAAKDRKGILDEVHDVVTEVMQNCTGRSKEEQLNALDSVLENLHRLKRKLVDVSAAEKDDAHRCKARLEHLKLNVKSQTRLDMILVDHLLRNGYNETACELASSSRIVDLVDCHIFLGAQKVVAALANHDCSEALAWCGANRAKLKKIKSKLEFKLRVQQFIELVREDKKLEAIQYARTHLSPWANQYMSELQHAVATLAFTANTNCSTYKVLFENSQWQVLTDLFYKELFRLNCLTPESLLVVHLQAGLSALKTPNSYQEGCSKEDPLHLPEFRILAEGLPYAKHVQSKLICSVTRELMNDANPPVVLPNGYVYSQKAVEQIMSRSGSKMICPRTRSEYSPEELRRAFIV